MTRKVVVLTVLVACSLLLLATGATIAPGAGNGSLLSRVGQADLTVELGAAMGDLASTDPVREAVGARALAAIGRNAALDVDLLIGLLETGNVRVRSPLLGITTPSGEARRALASIGEPAVMALVESLQDGGPVLRERAASTLGDIRSRNASDALAESLRDKMAEVRRSAAKALSGVRDRKTVPALIAVLREDPDWVVREKAAQALGAIRTPPCFDPLIHALGDSMQPVRDAACLALGELGDARAILPIVRDLADWKLTQAGVAAIRMIDSGVGGQALASIAIAGDSIRAARAIWALGELGDSGALPHLIPALKREEPDIRMMAAKSLMRIGDSRAVPDVIELLEDQDNGVRRTAAGVLGEFGDSTAVGSLIRSLGDRSTEVQEATIRSLGKIGDRRATSHIVPLMQHGSPYVRRASASTLGKIGSPESVPFLRVTLQDPDPSVQRFGENRDRWTKWWKESKEQLLIPSGTTAS